MNICVHPRSPVVAFRLAIFADHAIAITDEPVPCGTCGRAVTLLVNRDGRTRCCDCDGAHCATSSRTPLRDNAPAEVRR